MKRIWQFIRNWTLPLAMMAGVAEYFLFVNLPLDGEVRHQTYLAVTHYIQPILIFTMLFLSLIKVSPKEMRPHRWQAMALSVQTLLFVGFSILAMFMPDEGSKVLCEGAMLSLVCPTATASAVVTSKLGGSVSGVVTYLMLCNLMTSVAAPLFFPMVEPSEVAFFDAFLTILGLSATDMSVGVGLDSAVPDAPRASLAVEVQGLGFLYVGCIVVVGHSRDGAKQRAYVGEHLVLGRLGRRVGVMLPASVLLGSAHRRSIR